MKITQEQAKLFDNKCKEIDAHGFFQFLKKTKIHDTPFIDIISEIGVNLNINPSTPSPKIKISIDDMESLVIEFFASLSKDLGNKVKFMFSKNNPDYHIQYKNVKREDKRSSSVGHHDRNTYLDFTMIIHGDYSIDDLISLAHESSHAISSHHLHTLELIKNNALDHEINSYHNKRFDPIFDSAGEIESHIIEELFLIFLSEKNIIDDSFILDYRNNKLISMLNNINTVTEEYDIISRLPCPITCDSLNNLVYELQSNNNKTLLRRGEEMLVDKPLSKHRFRYIIAQIIATSWIEMYDKQDKTTKKKMLKTYEKYLNNTHDLDIFKTCEFLLDENLENTLLDFLQNLKENKVNL